MTKYAFLIGICYDKTNKRLLGIKNDLVEMREILIQKFNFQPNNIFTLSDVTKLPNISATYLQPTKQRILELLELMTQILKPGDRAVLYYSGHGTLRGGKSCIVPMDSKSEGMITNDIIFQHLNRISKDVNVFSIFDCCNSGSICKLKNHIYDTSFRKNLEIKPLAYSTLDWETRQHTKIIAENGELNANIVCLSSCWDDQVSYDLIKNGALTLNLLTILKFYNLSEMTFTELLKIVRGSLSFSRVKQTPQLMLSKIELKLQVTSILDFI
jgi:hypothetical protein